MRVKSLVILLVLVAAAAYVYYFQWDFVTSLFEGVRLNLAGYTAAKTPEDAMDRFAKAIKARDYNAAARYCTQPYADNFLKGKKAAYELAWRIDRLKNLMADKGLNSDRSMIILYELDPFPPILERSSDKEPKEIKKGDPKKLGWFKTESLEYSATPTSTKLDVEMFGNALMPDSLAVGLPTYYAVVLVPEGDGDNKTWKIDFPAEKLNLVKKKTDHMIKNYVGYTNTALDTLLDYVHRGSYDSKKAFEEELIDLLGKQNQK